MKFREQLKKIQDLGISICDLEIANEFDCVLDFEYSDEEFEQLCSYGLEIYLKAEEMTAHAIAVAVNNLVNTENKSVAEILSMDIWEAIEKASYYL